MKKKMSAILSTALLLCACGSNGAQGPIDVTKTPTATEAPTPSDADASPTEAPKKAEGVFSGLFASGDVEGNGGNFVRLGRNVYFREIKAEAFPVFSLFGEYLNETDGTVASTLAVYNLDNEETEELLDVTGDSALYAGVNGIFLGEINSDITRLIDPESGDVSKYCDGYPCAISEDGRQLAVRIWRSNLWYCDVWEDGELLYEIGPVDGGEEIYGFCGDYLICRAAVDDKNYEVVSYDKKGKRTSLGTIPRPDDSIVAPFPELIQFLPDSHGCYISVGYYEGTGHFLAWWTVMGVSPGQAGSLMELESSSDCEYPPTMYMEGDERPTVYQKFTKEIELSEGNYGDLIWHDSPMGVSILQKNFVFKEEYGDEYPPLWMENIQDAVILDKTAFVISAFGQHIEEKDIGWRPAYIPSSCFFQAIPFSSDHLDDQGIPDGYNILYSQYMEPDIIDVSELTGRWEEYSYIIEGYVGKPEDWEMQYLNFYEDGTVTMEKWDVDKNAFTTYTLTESKDDSGRPCYTVQIKDWPEEKYTMFRLIDDRLEVSGEWLYGDGTPGGNNVIYHKVTE